MDWKIEKKLNSIQSEKEEEERDWIKWRWEVCVCVCVLSVSKTRLHVLRFAGQGCGGNSQTKSGRTRNSKFGQLLFLGKSSFRKKKSLFVCKEFWILYSAKDLERKEIDLTKNEKNQNFLFFFFCSFFFAWLRSNCALLSQ